MSEDDFVTRWSRRKRQAAEIAKPTPVPEAFGSRAAPGRDEAHDKTEGLEFDPARLPPIDSITAVSDISAFLRAGVPPELTRAALSRVWTADPTIRDFVGLSENAWDFTDPNAMPGFGPLESTEAVRQMTANLVERIGRAAEDASPETPAGLEEVAQKPRDPDRINGSEEKQVGPMEAAAASERQLETPAPLIGNMALVQSNKEDSAMPRDGTAEGKISNGTLRRQHGGALPR